MGGQVPQVLVRASLPFVLLDNILQMPFLPTRADALRCHYRRLRGACSFLLLDLAHPTIVGDLIVRDTAHVASTMIALELIFSEQHLHMMGKSHRISLTWTTVRLGKFLSFSRCYEPLEQIHVLLRITPIVPKQKTCMGKDSIA